MSESMLRSLLQMLAGFSELSNDRPRKLMRMYLAVYLAQNFGKKLLEPKLLEFDTYQQSISNSHSIEKQLEEICTEITKVFTLQQRFLLLAYLLNFFNLSQNLHLINHGKTNSKSDNLDKVASWLKLPHQDYLNFRHFTFGKLYSIPQKLNLLISASKNTDLSGIRFLQCDGLTGYISFLRLASANLIMFNYNGTSKLNLNGKPIYSNNNYVLSSGFFISGPNVQSIYYGNVLREFSLGNESETITLVAEGATYFYPRSQKGIRNISFSGKSGEMHGILGGSGVGKSTLLNVISGNLRPQEGKTLVNGINLQDFPKLTMGNVGVLRQEENLVEELTVFENLYFSTKASVGKLSHEKIVELCQEKLAELDLTDCMNNKVGPPDNRQLSGGQRKRLAIAIEIVRNPKILLVDEPTSGLSSADSEMVMNILKNIALSGKLVIVNIHQPSSDIYKLFDGVIIIDRGGVPIYIGNPVEAILYFKKETDRVDKHSSACECCGTLKPEQIFDMVEERAIDEYGQKGANRKFTPEEWHQKYLDNCIKPLVFNGSSQIPSNLLSVPKLLVQFRTFFHRNLLAKLRNAEFIFFALILPALLSMLVSTYLRFSFQQELGSSGYSFYLNPNIPTFFSTYILSAFFFGLIVSCEDILRDRRIISREGSIGLSLKSFYNAKVLFLIIISTIQTFLLALPGVLILEVKDTLWELWFILLLVSFLGNLLGLILSSTLKSVVAIYILVPFLIVPQILFSGLGVPFDALNPKLTTQQQVPIIAETIPTRWATEALIVNSFINNRFNKPLFNHNFRESELRFRLLFLLPELYEQANKLATSPNEITNNDKEQIINGLNLLNEGSNRVELISSFDPWTSSSVRKIIELLEISQKTLAKEYSNAKHKRDRTIESIYPNTLQGRDYLNKTKELYHNIAIEGLVRNSQAPLPMVKEKNTYIQKTDPIYQLPTSPLGRSHYFAPFKRVGNLFLETYWFNGSMLVVMIFICYICFIFNIIPFVLKRILLFFRYFNYFRIIKL